MLNIILILIIFCSAKQLVAGEPNVSYICSRYYRAPELIFGATNYTTSIDVWSTGCVMAELMLGMPLFPGDSGVDQLVEIIKVLGTPTKEQIKTMNPNYTEFKFPHIKGHAWSKVEKVQSIFSTMCVFDYRLSFTITWCTKCDSFSFDIGIPQQVVPWYTCYDRQIIGIHTAVKIYIYRSHGSWILQRLEIARLQVTIRKSTPTIIQLYSWR